MITGAFSGDTIHLSGKNGIGYEAQLRVRLAVGLDAWCLTAEAALRT